MNFDPIWPFSPAEIVLWAELLAAWILVSYAIAPDSHERGETNDRDRRGLHSAAALAAVGLVGMAGWFLPAYGSSLFVRCGLTLMYGALMAANIAGRRTLMSAGRRRNMAEWEIGITIGAAIASATIIGLGQIGGLPANALIRSGKVAAAWCALASFAFVFRGGTYIVRSALDKANALPAIPVDAGSKKVDPEPNVKELNRGRAIGNLERLLMVIVIGLGSYEALGFLVAAKGLIRAREFEDRDFAEYFILGSLASVAVALVTGILLRVSLPYLWRIA